MTAEAQSLAEDVERVNAEAKEIAELRATKDADKIYMLEKQCVKEATRADAAEAAVPKLMELETQNANETARAEAAEAAVTELKTQILKLTQRRKPIFLGRVSSLITYLI